MEPTGNKKRKTKGVMVRLIIMFVICSVSITYAIGYFVALGNGKGPAEFLHYGWNLKLNNEEFSGIDLRTFSFESIKKGDITELTCTLPEKLPERAELVIPVHYYTVDLLIDDKPVFSADRDRFEQGLNLGSGFYSVDIGSGNEGKELKLIFVAGEDKAFSSLGSPEIWNADTYYQDYAAKKAPYLALAFFFIVVGMSMLIMSFAQDLMGTFAIADSVRFSSLSLLSMSFGIWIFTGMNLSEIFTNNIIDKVNVNYYSFYLIPIFFIGFHFETGRFKDEKGIKAARLRNIYCGSIWLFGVLFVIFVAYMQVSRGITPRKYLTASHIYDVIVVLMLLCFRVHDLVRKINTHFLSSYATIITGIATFIDLLRYNYYMHFSPRGSAGFTMSITYIVMVFFVLSLFFDYMSTAIIEARKEARIDLISKLAYSDALTGLNNRQATERFFDTVDKNSDPYIVVQFDLNNLKKANDTYGHEEGDKYIILFAETLRHVFEGKGYIARNGGDEFVYVLNPKEDGDRKWLEEKLKGLNSILFNKDTGHSGLTMSTAYGSYDSADDEAKTIRDGLRIADGRMYEMKKAMKASR